MVRVVVTLGRTWAARGCWLEAPGGRADRSPDGAQRILACAPPDPVVIFRLLAETAWSVLGCSGAVTSQPAGDAVVVRGVAGETPNPIGSTMDLDGTLTGLAVRTQTSQICDDWYSDPRAGGTPVPGPLSFAVVPLVHEGEVIAVVGAHSARLSAFDEQDLELLAMLAEVGAHRLAHALAPHSCDELQAQSSAVLDAMTAGLTVLDLNGTIRFANPAALAVFGLWVAVNAVPMHDRAGAMTGVVCSFDDITSRRGADATLQDARRRLEAALDLAGLATWERDLATGAVYWSPEMYAMFGLEPSPGPPDPALHLSVVEEAGRLNLEAMAKSCIATREPGHTTVRAIWPDGTRRYLWSQMDVATDAAGEVTTLWGNTQDITEREEAAQALAASEQHFRVAFDNAPISMSMIGLAPGSEGCYLRANAEFCTMLGYTSDEVLTLTMPDLTHVDDVEKDRARFAQLTSGAVGSVAFDKRFRRKDGQTVFAWVTSSVVLGPLGAPLFLITHALDMTPRRQQQAELERLALTDTLTGLANRTLLTDRLDQALARLQRVDGSCALLLLDIDRFKLVNDSLGHQVGDALLVEVAGRIEAASRADSTVARLGGDEFVVTVSIGVSVASSADRSHGDLFREADLALYRAKDSGRDQYALFDSALRSRVDARMEAENLLRRALAAGQVTPFFQPLIDLTTGRIRSAECLARIVLPGGEVVAPADFVEVAEETGLIVELDARIFELGMRQFALWSAQPDLALRRVAALGIHVGLDDFGTGYSALAYLQRFDLAFLKIDRSFVSQLGNQRDDAVVAAVIDLAHALELRVVAEGVETLEQLAALRAMGCDRAQGFLMGRPMPAEGLVALVRTPAIW